MKGDEKFSQPGRRDDMLTAYPLSKAAREISVTEHGQLINASIGIYRLISVVEVSGGEPEMSKVRVANEHTFVSTSHYGSA